MHVMHVIDSMHGGGAETSLLEVAPVLAARGVTMSIVTLLPDDGSLEDRLDALGVRHTRLKRHDPLRSARELRALIRIERPELLHTTLLFATLAGRMAAWATRTPVVTTLANEDYGPEHRAHSRYGPCGVGAAHGADLITAPLTTRFHAISREVAETMGRRLRIPGERIQVVYRGRDPARLGLPTPDRRLRIRAALSIDPTAPVVLSVARLDRQKNVDTTVEAFRMLLTRMPNAMLLIAGRPGNGSALVEAKARGCSNIRLLGHRSDVPDLMCAADVLSFPSRWEGLGGTLVEAMALRLAIVASEIRPVVEALGEVKWPLVQPDDASALAEALAAVIEGHTPSDALRDAGDRRFRVFFTAEAASVGMVDLYQHALFEARRQGA